MVVGDCWTETEGKVQKSDQVQLMLLFCNCHTKKQENMGLRKQQQIIQWVVELMHTDMAELPQIMEDVLLAM
jgi:hypothetical protein